MQVVYLRRSSALRIERRIVPQPTHHTHPVPPRPVTPVQTATQPVIVPPRRRREIARFNPRALTSFATPLPERTSSPARRSTLQQLQFEKTIAQLREENN